MIFNYSQMSISDIFGFKEHLIDKKLKMVFYFMYKKLETISHNNSGMNENQKRIFMNILKLYTLYVAYENPTILTTTGLA